MIKSLSKHLIAFLLGFLVCQLVYYFFPSGQVSTSEIKAAMIEAAQAIDLNPPAVNMQVQTLELGELDKLKLREFTYSPTFCADVIDLDGQSSRGIPDSLNLGP